LKYITDAGLAKWWLRLRKRQRLSERSITSFRKVADKLVAPLVRRYRYARVAV
jgi:hypothetical protein